MNQFEVNQKALDEFRVADVPKRALEDGEIRVAIDFFSFTANNMTYAAAGDMLGYWQFFPASGDDGFGIIPVWGFADVIESRTEGVDVGERFYGYFPPANELVMQPVNVEKRTLFDGAAHRQSLPPLYNRYMRVPAGGDSQMERYQALLGPLYNTGYCLWDQLHENSYYQAEQILVLSASSKTSIGMALALADDEASPKTIGITSPGNAEFVRSLGYYDEVATYDAIESIAQVPTAVVDMAGNASTAAALTAHLGDGLQRYISVGLTHWDQADTSLGGDDERKEWFFAPTYMLERAKAMAPGEFPRLAQNFVVQAATKSASWLQLQEVTGVSALSERYADICAGRMNPAEGLICKL